MKNNIYLKLALQNIRTKRNIYLPYILSSAVMFAMLYDLLSIRNYNGEGVVRRWELVQSALGMGLFLSAIFVLIFLSSSTAYIVRQSKKTYGLYVVLGMNKINVNIIMVFESIILFIMSFSLGLLSGMLFIKFLFAILLKMTNTNMLPIGFFNLQSFIILLIFGLINLAINIVFKAFKVSIAKPISLLNDYKKADKLSKSHKIMSVLGIIALIAGYIWANIIEFNASFLLFYTWATLLVIVGTYYFMSASLENIFKRLQKNKKYYYNKSHFLPVSSIIYRLRSNGSSLGSICVLFTGILLVLSATIAVFYGAYSRFDTNNSPNYMIGIYEREDKENQVFLDDDRLDEIRSFLENEMKAKNIQNSRSLSTLVNASDNKLDIYLDFYSASIMELMSLDTYNKINKTNIEMTEKMLVYDSANKLDENKKLIIGDGEYAFKKAELNLKKYNLEVNEVPSLVIVVKDEDVFDEIAGFNAWSHAKQDTFYFDLEDGNYEAKIGKIESKLNQIIPNHTSIILSLEQKRDVFFSLNGSLLFIGALLSLILITCTAIIIYYKQISEAHEDVKRYKVLSKIGMSKYEIRKSINTQVRMVFYLPILLSLVHSVFAFNMIKTLSNLIGLSNPMHLAYALVLVSLVAMLIYTLIYKASSKTYYRIISEYRMEN